MSNNVIDMKTRGAIFNPQFKAKLQNGLKPYLGNDADPAFLDKVVDTLEQVICTSIVIAAKNIASKVIAKLSKHFEP